MNRWPGIVIGLFVLAAAVTILQFFVRLWPASGWADTVLLILAVAAAIAALAKQLPVVNVTIAAGIAAGLGGIAHAINDVSGLPFGRFEFTTAFGPRLLGVLPIAILGIWATAALSARGVARVVLRNTRNHQHHGYQVIGLAVGLMTVFQALLIPYGAMVKGWWSATPVPILNLIGCGLVSLLIQVAITPMILDKFPGPRPPNFWPLAVWLALHVVLVTGLFIVGRSAEALLGLAVGGIITVLALRTGNRTVTQAASTT